MKTKTRPWGHIYLDIGTPRKKSHDNEVPRPKNCNIEIRGRLKHHNIKKQSQLNHDMVIASHFSRGQKATTLRFQDWKTTTSRFQDQKATTLSFCGIWPLFPPDNNSRLDVVFNTAEFCSGERSYFNNTPMFNFFLKKIII